MEDNNTPNNYESVSPKNLADIKLRLLLNKRHNNDTQEAIRELIGLGADARPLIPLLVELYASGKIPLRLDNLINLCANTGDTALLEACRQKGEHKKAGPYEMCRLFALGIDELEDDLIEHLWQHWQGLEPECVEVVKTLGKHGGKKSLDVLEVLGYRLAGSVQEISAKVANYVEEDCLDPEKARKIYCLRGSEALLTTVRESVALARARCSASGAAKPLVSESSLVASQESQQATPRPEDVFSNIEKRLGHFVLEILKKKNTNWWEECVSLTIRQKCAARCEDEKNRHPKEAYFDFIDLKKLIQDNWQEFEKHLRSAGCQGNKDKSLAWMDKLNELRRFVGHPWKAHVAGHQFSTDDLRVLKECEELVGKLESSRGT
jgi:hypothetical protein